MRRLVAGGLALGLTAVGGLALGGPAWAQEDPPEDIQLEGSLSATLVAPGEEVTASSVEPCSVPDEGAAGELYWSLWSLDGEFVSEDFLPLEADGSWSVAFEAPGEAGDYEFFAVCVPGDLAPEEEENLEDLASEAPSTLGDEPEGEEPEGEEPGGEEPPPYPAIEYYLLPFTVDGGDGPGTEPPPAPAPTPPVAAPATPVVDDPIYTG